MNAWLAKFGHAFRGLGWAARTQNSFWVHIPIGVAVILVAAVLKVDTLSWAVLSAAIAMVLAAELINTAIEILVKRLHPEYDPTIGKALDAAAGAVLVLSIAAVFVGLLVLGPPLWQVLG